MNSIIKTEFQQSETSAQLCMKLHCTFLLDFPLSQNNQPKITTDVTNITLVSNFQCHLTVSILGR
ncbi:hypothetical protein T10_1572 [Trichinella papuae]|uniref:Uncharacterized protein n=1 Tax=Trichinella papuae TaxID=268474 RepID=A0A0V1N4R4_9BILA|nr:hypothetical protein T10_1572 [Trichinella papuae]